MIMVRAPDFTCCAFAILPVAGLVPLGFLLMASRLAAAVSAMTPQLNRAGP